MSRLLIYPLRKRTNYVSNTHLYKLSIDNLYKIKTNIKQFPSRNVELADIKQLIISNDIQKIRIIAQINQYHYAKTLACVVRFARLSELEKMLSNFSYSLADYKTIGQSVNMLCWYTDPISNDEYDKRFIIFKSYITQ